MEPVNPYTSYWGDKMKLDLRNDKFERMRNGRIILLCVDVFYRKFFIVDFQTDNVPAEYIEFHAPYGKPAYRIDLNKVKVVDLIIDLLVQEVNQHT